MRGAKRIWLVLAAVFLLYYAYAALVHFPLVLGTAEGPDGLEARLYAAPDWGHPLTCVLVAFRTLHHNVHAYVDVREDGKLLERIDVARSGDVVENYDDTEMRWHERELTIIDEVGEVSVRRY
jgi:hypothetical protein